MWQKSKPLQHCWEPLIPSPPKMACSPADWEPVACIDDRELPGPHMGGRTWETKVQSPVDIAMEVTPSFWWVKVLNGILSVFIFTLKQELNEQQKKTAAYCSAEVTAYASGCHAHTFIHTIILWGHFMVNMVAFGKEMHHIHSLAIEFWNSGCRFIINGKRGKNRCTLHWH